MGKGLTGKKIAITGTRKHEEIATLIEKQGGETIIRPLQGTVFLAEKEVEPDLRKFVQNGADWVVLTTGIGTETLINLAGKLGVQAQFMNIIRNAKIAARGYKTATLLKKLGLKSDAVDDDGTNRGLVRALEKFDFSGKKVMVQLHGESAPGLIRFLEDKGAQVHQILPYQHTPPQTDNVEQLCQELLHHKVDAVCFTTAIQVHSLFDYAKKQGYLNDILVAFKDKTLACAVGKITAEAIREAGIDRLVSPELERMGAMVIELSRYYQNEVISS